MRRYHGLTIIELMVTLAVAIVLLAVGVPMYQEMQERSRATAQANDLVTAVQLARNEALSRGEPISVCGLSAAGSTNCGNDTQAWENGWQVFVDNGANPNQVDGGEPQIRVFEGLDADTTGLTQTATTPALRFLASGELDGDIHDDTEWVRFAYPHATESERCVTVGLVGTARVSKKETGVACTP